MPRCLFLITPATRRLSITYPKTVTQNFIFTYEIMLGSEYSEFFLHYTENDNSELFKPTKDFNLENIVIVPIPTGSKKLLVKDLTF